MNIDVFVATTSDNKISDSKGYPERLSLQPDDQVWVGDGAVKLAKNLCVGDYLLMERPHVRISIDTKELPCIISLHQIIKLELKQ